MALFVIGSALTVAVFFLALWLLPDKPFTTLSFPAISLMSVTSSALLRPGPPASKPTGRDLPRPGRGPDHDQDESHFEAGRVDRAIQKMRAAVQKK
jgi:hypothetical protein